MTEAPRSGGRPTILCRRCGRAYQLSENGAEATGDIFADDSEVAAGGDFTNQTTALIQPDELRERLESMRNPDAQLGQPAADEWAVFEHETTVAAPRRPAAAPPAASPASVRSGWLARFDRPRTLQLAGIVLAAGLLVAAAVLWLVPSHAALYVQRAAVLRSGPGNGTDYVAVAHLQPGARVQLMRRSAGEALVRDLLGRVGYVPADALAAAPVASSPELPFADCFRAPGQSSSDRCHGRAQKQFRSCRAVCRERGDVQPCVDRCQTRLTTCVQSCDGTPPAAKKPAPVLESPASTTPTARAAPTPTRPAPHARHSSRHHGKAAHTGSRGHRRHRRRHRRRR